MPPRKKKLFKKTKQKKEQKSAEQTSETSEKTMVPIQSAISINLNGTYQAEEAAKYLEKLAFLLADMQEKEVEIKLSIQHKL